MKWTDKNGRSGFTLIELMVVVVIVGILFLVAMPMFENAGRKDPRAAAQTLVNTLRLARQHAISRRQWTLVIFPNNQDTKYTANVKDINNLDKCLRSYAVIAVTNNMDGADARASGKRDPDADHMDFEFLTEWRTLPEGIYFDDEEGIGHDNYLFGKVSTSGYAGRFEFPWDPANPQKNRAKMSAMLFKPNGRAYVMSDDSSTGKYWQDTDGSRIYVSSAVFYPDASGTSLGNSQEMPGGTTAIIKIRNKTGQITLDNVK